MATKKLFIALLCVLSFVPAIAENKNLKNDVTMVSYEQSWLDYKGTIALKNNTSDVIHNIVFQLTYLDMSGNELDYEVFEREVRIDPGKTKKLDLPAYEHSRQYHYYKTKDEFGHPAFKINFQLKDYNVEKSGVADSEDYYDTYDYDDAGNPLPRGSSYGSVLIVMLVFLLVFIGIYVGLYVLVAVMAKKRNRNVVLWVLLSLFATPLLMIIILLVIGKEENPMERRSL